MKQITLKHYAKKRKDTLYNDFRKYNIFLGSENWIRFTNKKDADKYLAETSRFFNLVLDELIYYTTQIYAEVWRYWQLTDSEEMQFFESFHNISRTINNTIRRAKTDNSDSIYFIKINFKKINTELIFISDAIINHRRRLNKHAENRMLKIILNNIKDIQKKLDHNIIIEHNVKKNPDPNGPG